VFGGRQPSETISSQSIKDCSVSTTKADDSDSDHEGLKEFLSLFKDVETTFVTVSTRKDQSSLKSSNESISFDTIDSVSPSGSLRSLFVQSDDF